MSVLVSGDDWHDDGDAESVDHLSEDEQPAEAAAANADRLKIDDNPSLAQKPRGFGRGSPLPTSPPTALFPGSGTSVRSRGKGRATGRYAGRNIDDRGSPRVTRSAARQSKLPDTWTNRPTNDNDKTATVPDANTTNAHALDDVDS
jgi:hypothetical protein